MFAYSDTVQVEVNLERRNKQHGCLADVGVSLSPRGTSP